MRTRPSGDRPYRVGLIVPSSNTTMETEIPVMVADSDRCAAELADAEVDVVA